MFVRSTRLERRPDLVEQRSLRRCRHSDERVDPAEALEGLRDTRSASAAAPVSAGPRGRRFGRDRVDRARAPAGHGDP